eukprot:13639351-Alexandrium_andersonii.AAC.1
MSPTPAPSHRWRSASWAEWRSAIWATLCRSRCRGTSTIVLGVCAASFGRNNATRRRGKRKG